MKNQQTVFQVFSKTELKKLLSICCRANTSCVVVDGILVGRQIAFNGAASVSYKGGALSPNWNKIENLPAS